MFGFKLSFDKDAFFKLAFGAFLVAIAAAIDFVSKSVSGSTLDPLVKAALLSLLALFGAAISKAEK